MTIGRRSLAFLVLCGCLPSPTAAPPAAQDTSPLRADEAGVAARVGRADVRFDADGVWLQGAGTLALGVSGWGRDALRPAEPVAPELQTSDGATRAVYARPGLTEWWEVEGTRLHQGFDVAEAPEGDGPLTIEVAVDGDVTLRGETAWIVDAAGSTWSYAELWAWDDTGRELDAALDVVDGRIHLVVDDTDAVYPLHIDPVVSTASATLVGEGAGDEAGSAVALVGDLNGDGYDDLAVGAPMYGGGAGRVYVHLGGAAGVATTAATVLTGAAGDELGAAVAGAGDVDHDGYDDLVVGAPGAGGGAGAVTVYYGSASGLDTAGATTLAGASGESLGAAVTGAGDVDADGYADVAVGGPDYNLGRGRVLVLGGAPGGLDTSPLATLTGGTVGAAFGQAVAGGGDVNADGYDDLVIGSPGYSAGAGRGYVYLGASGGVATPANLIVNGSGTDALGTAVALLGDADRDGFDDIAFGAPGETSGAGAARVHLGAATGPSTSASRILRGEAAGDAFGSSLAGGDVHGDGYADLVVGAAERDGATGRVYVYRGGSAGIGSVAETAVDGPAAGSRFGAALTGAADLDQNGADDVAVGAPGVSASTGAAYVYAATVDADGDGYDLTTDCDDGDPAVNPGATEVTGDGVDSDCDGGEICFVDADDDGFRTSGLGTVVSADADCTDAGEALASDPTGDCADANARVNPGAREVPDNGTDEDCDGMESCYVDADGDGQRPDRTTLMDSADLDCTDAGEGQTSDGTGDCNDGDATVFAGAVEVVGDGIDQDCDGGDTCYADLDDDGYRTDSLVASTDLDCDDTGEALPADPAGDCADGNASTHPGATEITGDNIDENCDGAEVCFVDVDGDNYRPDDVTTVFSPDSDCSDTGEATAVDPSGDCDDGDRGTNPAATEVPGDQLDEDCDGGEICYVDADGDGSRASGLTVVASADLDCTDAGEALLTSSADCDDTDASVHVGATDVPSDGIDQDCDGWDSCYVDFDNDGYRTDNVRTNNDGDCTDPGEASASTPSGDCDDRNASFNPGASDTPGDGLDQDCDGTESCFADADGDGHRPDAVSTVESADGDCNDPGEATSRNPSDDCDDTNPDVHGDAREIAGDGIDEDCDGVEQCLPDTDGDGYRPDSAYTITSADLDCSDPGEATEATPAGDCDDADATRNPGATEIIADEIDQNCDGGELCYADVDADGYRPDDGSTITSVDRDCDDLGEATGATPAGDCDDNARGYHPGAREDDCTDPNDYNCDGSTGYADADGDGTAACEDCNDADAAVNPTAAELCNGYDDNCDGRIDGPASADAQTWYADRDEDGYPSESDTEVACTAPDGYTEAAEAWDCNDQRPTVNPGAVDHPNDGVDQDCDGIIDNAPGDTGEVDDTKSTGCGCATDPENGTGAAAALAGLAALTLGRRRERR